MGVGIYLFILFLFILLLLLYKQNNNSFVAGVPFFLLAAFSGFRYQVGSDYESYEYIFQVVTGGIVDATAVSEIGYFYLVKIVDFLNGTQQLIFLVMAFFTVLFIYKYIRENNYSFFMSSFIYLTIGPFFLSSFNAVRQALAIAIFAYAIKYIKEKKVWKYSLYILTAFLFHYSAIFMWPLYFFLTRKINYIKFFAILMGVILVTRTSLIQKVLSFSHYSNYLHYNELQIDNSVLVFLILSFLLVFLGKKKDAEDSWTIFYNLNLLSFFTILTAYLTSDLSNMIFMRLNSYFFIGWLIFVPMNLSRVREKKLVYLFTIVVCIGLYMNTVMSDGNHTLPYNVNFRLFN